MESRDDELKDSFETAVSSVSSSAFRTKQQPIITQAPLTHSVIHDAADMDYLEDSYPPEDTLPKRDQIEYRTNGFLQKQDTIDYQPTIEKVPSIHEEDDFYTNVSDYLPPSENRYLQQQESIDSYGDDILPEKPHESPVSVIHIDRKDSTRRSSVVDSFRPGSPPRRPSHDSFAGSRKPSVEVSTSYLPTPPRKSSIEPSLYQQIPPSVPVVSSISAAMQQQQQQQLIQQQSDIEQLGGSDELLYEEEEDQCATIISSELKSPRTSVDQSGEEREPPKVSFEEEEKIIHRDKITAKQRWLWAFSKLLLQMDVSTNFYYLLSETPMGEN